MGWKKLMEKDVCGCVKSYVEIWWGIEGPFNLPLFSGWWKKDFKDFKHLMVNNLMNSR